MSGQSTPAGWYPDPQNPGQQRYWDGAAWSEATQPGAAAAPAAGYGQPVGYGYAQGGAGEQASVGVRFVAALIVAMVVVGGITRLTESGLSITQWKPISGIVPPLTAACAESTYGDCGKTSCLKLSKPVAITVILTESFISSSKTVPKIIFASSSAS